MFSATQGSLAKLELNQVKDFETHVLDLLDGQQFFLSRISNNQLKSENLKGIFGVSLYLIERQFSFSSAL